MRYIIISGIDGSGKTSIIEGIEVFFTKRKKTSVVIWLRYNHYFVKPLHAIARLLGLSKQYNSSEGKVWRHEFYKSTIFSWFYIRFTYLDTLIGKMKLNFKIKNKLDIVICDRWLNDILIDLGTKTHNEYFLSSKWYNRFKKMLPNKSNEFLITRNEEDLLKCRLENQEDPDFNFRLKLYKKLEKKKDVVIINNISTIEMAVNKIISKS